MELRASTEVTVFHLPSIYLSRQARLDVILPVRTSRAVVSCEWIRVVMTALRFPEAVIVLFRDQVPARGLS